MTLESDHQKFLEAFEEYKKEFDTFNGGTKAAAARSRKKLSEMSKLAKSMRSGISDKLKKMGTRGGAKKSRKKKKSSKK
jgi:hypothetical protein